MHYKKAKSDSLFLNGRNCIKDKKRKFVYENRMFKKFKPPSHPILYCRKRKMK